VCLPRQIAFDGGALLAGWLRCACVRVCVCGVHVLSTIVQYGCPTMKRQAYLILMGQYSGASVISPKEKARDAIPAERELGGGSVLVCMRVCVRVYNPQKHVT
jgi:hypothetical protein